jgi:hypothetical protein
MTEIQELEKRIETLEKKKESPARFFLQYLLSPLLLLVIGFLLNYQIEKAKQGFQLIELELKRIEATQKFVTELFSDNPQRALIAERLIAEIVEEKLAKDIAEIVENYYKGKVEKLVARKEFEKLMRSRKQLNQFKV